MSSCWYHVFHWEKESCQLRNALKGCSDIHAGFFFPSGKQIQPSPRFVFHFFSICFSIIGAISLNLFEPLSKLLVMRTKVMVGKVRQEKPAHKWGAQRSTCKVKLAEASMQNCLLSGLIKYEQDKKSRRSATP